MLIIRSLLEEVYKHCTQSNLSGLSILGPWNLWKVVLVTEYQIPFVCKLAPTDSGMSLVFHSKWAISVKPLRFHCILCYMYLSFHPYSSKYRKFDFSVMSGQVKSKHNGKYRMYICDCSLRAISLDLHWLQMLWYGG